MSPSDSQAQLSAEEEGALRKRVKSGHIAGWECGRIMPRVLATLDEARRALSSSEPSGARTREEMRAYVRDLIGLEIIDRNAALKRYSAEGIALLAEAARLLREGGGPASAPGAGEAELREALQKASRSLAAAGIAMRGKDEQLAERFSLEALEAGAALAAQPVTAQAEGDHTADARNMVTAPAEATGGWRPIAEHDQNPYISCLVVAEGVVGEAYIDSKPDAQWWWWNTDWSDNEPIIPAPTHFMPLPPPPETTGMGGER